MNLQRHRRLRRLSAVVALPTAAALLLAGCGGDDEPAGSGESPGTGETSDGEAAAGFSFVYATSTTTESPWETLANRYSEETGVEIETQALPNDSYQLTLRTQLQGGNAADVMVLSPGSGQDNAVLTLADADFLEPLGEGSAAVIPEGSEGLFTLDGTVYAQPTDLVPVGIAFNSGAAAEAGVEFPADADEMLELCTTLASEGKSLVALAGSAPQNLGLMAMSIAATRVYAETPDWNQQRAAGDVTFADSGWQDVLQTIVDMNDGGCFQEGAAGGGFDAITNGITQGTSLGAFVPGGAATELMAATPGLTIDIQSFPPAAGSDPYLLASPNYALGISSASDDAVKQAAMDFLAWLAEPDNAAEFTQLSGGVPISGVEDATLEPQYEPVATLLEDGDYAPLPNAEWINPGVYDALSTGIQGLLVGSGDIASVLEAVDQAWES